MAMNKRMLYSRMKMGNRTVQTWPTDAGLLRVVTDASGEVRIACFPRLVGLFVCTTCRISSFADAKVLWPRCPQCWRQMDEGKT